MHAVQYEHGCASVGSPSPPPFPLYSPVTNSFPSVPVGTAQVLWMKGCLMCTGIAGSVPLRLGLSDVRAALFTVTVTVMAGNVRAVQPEGTVTSTVQSRLPYCARPDASTVPAFFVSSSVIEAQVVAVVKTWLG